MNDKLLIDLLKRHAPEILGLISHELAQSELAQSAREAVDARMVGDDPVKHLPKELQCKLQNKRAFRRAWRKGLIDYRQCVWVSRFENKSVFSMFIGRCFSGDYVKNDVFMKGDFSFPARELERLFNMTNLRDSRKFLLNKKISRRCKCIDYLFDN